MGKTFRHNDEDEGYTVGTTTYHLTPKEMKRLRACAKEVHTDWRPFAARPSQAREMIARVEAGNLSPMGA